MKMNAQKKLVFAAEGKRALEIAQDCSSKGVKAVIVMPNWDSSALLTRIRDCGVELILTPAEMGLRGAHEMAKEMQARMDKIVLM